MFTKILIANRGEIACRVIATARRLGIATVAVYSDADAGARHVALADEAVRIGPAPAADSYLRGERIIAAARATGAQAIHPGYGFLSENPDFVEAVGAAGLTFIGPPAEAIRAMGLKDAAKALMEAAGVPVVPGYHGGSQDPDRLATEAERIGYPVLIKARSGGGGKGMRLVEAPGDFRTALEGAQREGQASFGDPACLIEKYVTCPRHVEIQVFGDSHGTVVHLFERDCSLQRRHQKVIEEAPAPGMPAEVRAAMGRAAVEAARAVGYQGAGTVEFIADGSGPLRADGFWFMEMNTRLQVEHPVTEAITGLDLVALQLAVAAGEPLPFGQDDLALTGHAFEARIYAEDVGRGFLPATGRVAFLETPQAAEFALGPVRVDSGIRQGDAITPYYDPMIAKLIVHGPTRRAALDRLGTALGQFRVAGSVTNIAFLSALARHPGFAAGEVYTGLIGRDLAALTEEPEPSDAVLALAALAALGLPRAAADPGDPWTGLVGWRHWGPAERTVALERGGRPITLAVAIHAPDRFTIATEDRRFDAQAEPDGAGVAILHDNRRLRARTVIAGSTITVFLDGAAFDFAFPEALSAADEDDASTDLVTAPMPGIVRAVPAEAGQDVARGASLVVLEAMKMEYTLAAPRDGRIAEILASIGDQVTEGAVLVRLVPEAGDG